MLKNQKLFQFVRGYFQAPSHVFFLSAKTCCRAFYFDIFRQETVIKLHIVERKIIIGVELAGALGMVRKTDCNVFYIHNNCDLYSLTLLGGEYKLTAYNHRTNLRILWTECFFINIPA